MRTKTFYYRNNSLKQVFTSKEKAETLAKREAVRFNIRIETYTFDELVQSVGQNNAERMWSK